MSDTATTVRCWQQYMQPLSSAVSHGNELYNKNSFSASPVTELFVYMCVPCVAAAAIRRRGLVEEIRYHHHYGGKFVRLLLLPQLLLSTKNLTF